MKTQFIVTFTQTAESPATPQSLGDVVRRTMRGEVKEMAGVSVTVRHVVEDDTEPATDTLEALVREYGNSPTTGKGRVRADVLADIRALIHNSGTQVAENSAKPSVPVEEAVATLNATVDQGKDAQVRVGQKRLHNALVDTHRAGQMTGRLLGKEGRERAAAFADNVIALLVHA